MSSLSRSILRSFSTSFSFSKSKVKSFADDLYKERNLKRVVEKFKKFSESHEFRKQANIYGNTVHRLASAKKFNWVEEILEDQKTYDDISKEGFSVRLISLYGKAGMFEHASKVFDEMPGRNCPQSVKSFNALLGACVKAKKLDKIDGLFKDLPYKLSVKPDVVSYNTMIKAFSEMGSLNSAVSIFNEMKKNGLAADLITFNTLLGGFYGNGRFLDGEKFWAKMVDMGIKPNIITYNARLNGLISEKKIGEAVEVFRKLESKDLLPDAVSYNVLIRGYCNENDLEQAKKWYVELVNSDLAPNKATFAALIPCACKMADFKWAIELFKKIFEQKCLVDPEILQIVVDGLIKEAKIEDAKKIVEIANSNQFRVYDLVMPSYK